MLGAGQLIAVGILLLLTAYVAMVDFSSMIIPDAANLAIFVAGVVCSTILDTVDPLSGLVASLLGGGLLLAVKSGFLAYRGYDGLGLGDVKLMGAAGPWIGASGIPIVLLVACATALSYVALSRAMNPAFDGREPLPFGPFLAAGITLVASVQILTGTTWLDVLDHWLA